ncbi:DoxX family protein [Dyella solisilvae]|uniref:DoxX family protein n=1 Tax=Dyella solisilvae TaxID=1920168 RepID=A0A370K5J0_9GAMM|nr:DoxX family protein [Dyella solisilvae]RDI97913.1 DoxX family protein [Dyella solisilvae]
MDRSRSSSPAQLALALSMIALGCLGFIHGDVAMVWQHIPFEHLPGQRAIAYACATIELATGLGLLLPSTAATASAVLFVFMALWVVVLKLPAVLVAPGMEATWLGAGEIAVILAGSWILLATHARRPTFLVGTGGVRCARILFALSLPTIGLAHFFYAEQTAALVPAWLPWRMGWAYFTGAASLAACLGVLLGILPRLAATLESAMLGVITVLVWAPAIITNPTDRTAWTALVISAAIASGAWLVAESYRGEPWLARDRYPSALPAR